MRILIIRHGDPDYSIDSLTPRGWQEAELLAQRLKDENISKIYVSPLGRAKDTAAPTCKLLGIAPEVQDWLQEFVYKANDPRTGKDELVYEMHPAYWQNEVSTDLQCWDSEGLYAHSEAGARYTEVCAGIDALLLRHGYQRKGKRYVRTGEPNLETIAIFCHHGTTLTLLSHFLSIAPPVMWHCFFMPTSSVTTVVTEERRPGDDVLLRTVQLGDTSHLYAGGMKIAAAGFTSVLGTTWEELETRRPPVTVG